LAHDGIVGGGAQVPMADCVGAKTPVSPSGGDC
jgi:hypothetical protein